MERPRNYRADCGLHRTIAWHIGFKQNKQRSAKLNGIPEHRKKQRKQENACMISLLVSLARRRELLGSSTTVEAETQPVRSQLTTETEGGYGDIGMQCGIENIEIMPLSSPFALASSVHHGRGGWPLSRPEEPFGMSITGRRRVTDVGLRPVQAHWPRAKLEATDVSQNA